MPVDPQMQTVLDGWAALPPIYTVSVADAWAQFKLPRPAGLRIAEVASVADRSIPRPAGALRVRVCTPHR